MRFPVRVHEGLQLVRKASARHFQDYRDWPTPEEVLDVLRRMEGNERAKTIPLEEVAELLLLGVQRSVSLNAKVRPRSGHAEDGVTNDEVIPDVRVDVESYAESRKLEERFKELLSRLSPREALIISQRFGLGGAREMTLEEVARQFELTRERIRQIEAKALRKMKAFLAPHAKEYFELRR